MAQHKDDTLLEAQRAKLKPPPMFKVMLLNDDYTPMEFVVVVLQKFFAMTRERATQVMLKVHREGIGVCGVYPRDVASTDPHARRRVRERPHDPADDSERQRRVHYEEIVIVDRGRAHPDEDLTVPRNRNGDVSDLRRALLAADHSFHEG